MKQLIAWHKARYPLMESQDQVKLLFQAMLGCGHLLGSHEQVAARIQAEMDQLSPDSQEPLTEPAGPMYMRVNLRRAMAEGIHAEWLAGMMIHSRQPLHTREDAANLAAQLLPEKSANDVISKLRSDASWLPSHTAGYHAAYHPAYRIISTDWLKPLQVLAHLARHWQKERILMLIDGPCGSGKSTLAGKLQPILDAALVPMDDFFLPHPQKTAERLAQPGGNADWERLAAEVLTPWLNGDSAAYRPYLCHAGCMGEIVTVPRKKVTIIEGSYSMMPKIRKHADVCVFLAIQEDLQHHRILQRNGEEALEMFRSRWIPLEKAYFDAYNLPDDKCLVLQVDQDA